MDDPKFSARQFFLWSGGAVVGLSVVIAVAALLTAVPWGGADERVRDALPASQGETAPAQDG